MWKSALAQYDNLGVYTPNPAHLMILLGLTFAVALIAFLHSLGPLHSRSDRDLLIKGWFFINLVIVYLPLRFRIMLLAGFKMVMAALVTDWLYDRFIPWLSRQHRWCTRSIRARLLQFVPVVFVLLVLPTNLYLLAWRVNYLRRAEYPFYLAQSDISAIHWLEKNSSPEDVVLSAFHTGHFIPGLAGNKAFLANAVMTMDFYEKQSMLYKFFDVSTSDSWRSDLFHKFSVDYVFYGPAERAVGSYDPAESPLFMRAFDAGYTVVFRVIP